MIELPDYLRVILDEPLKDQAPAGPVSVAGDLDPVATRHSRLLCTMNVLRRVGSRYASIPTVGPASEGVAAVTANTLV